MKHTLTMVTMRHPCSACYLIQGVVEEVLARVCKEMDGVTWEHVMLDHPSNAYEAHVEVELYPAVLLDGEQLTAGAVPDRRRIMALIRKLEEQA